VGGAGRRAGVGVGRARFRRRVRHDLRVSGAGRPGTPRP
jgi:hypothetical protein